jgi:hypothetical protein
MLEAATLAAWVAARPKIPQIYAWPDEEDTE